MTEAAHMCAVMADLGVEWVEEPLRDDDLSTLEEFATRSPIPVAVGENIYGVADYRHCATAGVFGQIQPDVAKNGGLTMARDVVDATRGTRSSVSPHYYGGAVGLAATVTLAAAYHVIEWVELDVHPNPLRTDLLTEPLVVRDGCAAAPSGAGIASEVDADVVTRFQVLDETRTARPSPPVDRRRDRVPDPR